MKTEVHLGLIFGLICWIVIGGLYILRTPWGAFSHDYISHVAYTHIIADQHRLPAPREGWETYQPPFYYLMNSLMNVQSSRHPLWVRMASVEYGLLTLALMGFIFVERRVPPLVQGSILLFTATTPAFIFVFGSYNNDALATMLSALIIFLAYKLCSEWRRSWAFVFLISTVVGLYTKLTVLYPILVIGITTVILRLLKKIPAMNAHRVVGILLLGVLGLVPWLLMHNYRNTHVLFPAPADNELYDAIKLPHSPWRTLLTPPGWSPGEWKDPYAHLWEATSSKRNSYLAYLFITSIYGEYSFDFMAPWVLWSIVIIHAVLYGYALFEIRKSDLSRAAGLALLLAVMVFPTLFFHARYTSLMDFRYISWTWILWGILLAEIASPSVMQKAPTLLTGLLAAGSVLHLYLWISLVLAAPRWYY